MPWNSLRVHLSALLYTKCLDLSKRRTIKDSITLAMCVCVRAYVDTLMHVSTQLHLPSEFGILYLVVPCFLVACMFHPSLNNDAISDISWTFSMYMEVKRIPYEALRSR
jgi:hypothetical protein